MVENAGEEQVEEESGQDASLLDTVADVKGLLHLSA